jgi:hypothetical protein
VTLARSGPLERKTALRRGDKPLARGRQLERGKPLKTGKRLKPISDDRRAELPERAAVRAAVFERDGYRCQFPGDRARWPCFGGLSFHHLRKEGQGGSYTAENGLSLCIGHNRWVEDHPLIARQLDLVR